jgi:recombinational DNA repair protein (RecF pathway)
MQRIVRSEAVCLRVQDYHESSKLVTFFTLERGKVSCLAKGARRLRSKFGAALDLFAQSRIIYYSHETRTLLTLSDAELVRSFSSLALLPERFLAAEQMSEFVLHVIQPLDPSPQLYQLLLNYLSTLENLQDPVCSLQSSGSADLQSATGIDRQERQGRQGLGSDNPQSPDSAILHFAVCSLTSPYPALVCSFLLKAASFLGFRPELRRCLICRRPIESQRPAFFDPGRGGIICPRCAGDKPSGTRLDPASLDTLSFLLYTPASEIAQVCSAIPQPAVGINRQDRQGSGPDNLQSPPPVSSAANLESKIYNLQSPPLVSSSANLQSAICNLQSPLDLVLGFLGHHFDPLVLNSFRWHAGLERNP